jgi:hypothetical protein
MALKDHQIVPSIPDEPTAAMVDAATQEAWKNERVRISHVTMRAALRAAFAVARGSATDGVPVPHPFKEWTGGGPVRPYCASCGRSRNDPLHTDGVERTGDA